MQSPRIRVDLGVIAMKEYFTLPRFPEVSLYHEMPFIVIPRTLEKFKRIALIKSRYDMYIFTELSL